MPETSTKECKVMSQDKGNFQSKRSFGGQKFGSKGKGRGRPGGGGFSKRFEGDRDDRKPRGAFGGGKNKRPFREKRDDDAGHGGWDKKPRSFKDGDSRGKRFDRSERRDDRGGGFDRPFEKRSFGGEKNRRPFREKRDNDAGRSGGWDKKPRSFRDDDSQGQRSDRPFEKRSFGGGKSRDGFRGGKDRGGFRDDKKRFHGPKRPYQRYGEDDRQPPKRTRERNDYFEEQELSSEPASLETRQKLKSERSSYGAPSSAFLFGIHAVSAALLNPKRQHQRLLCTQNGFESVKDVYQEALDKGLTLPEVTYVEREDIDRLLPRDAVHQGILLDCQPLEEVFLPDIILTAPDDAKVIVLDQVTDPHNIGAIIRSASAFGARAVIVQKLHAPDVTGTLAKSASGAVEHVPLIREVNLSRAIESLKEAGFFCVGLAEEGKNDLTEVIPAGKVAIVLGAEGDGLRRLVAESCNTLAKLPTSGPILSLNVSNAAAVALYELSKNR